METSNASTPARPPPRSPLGVDEEYDSAFKSKSFLDLWSQAHHHLRHTFSSFKSGGVKDSRHGDAEVDAAAAASPAMEQSCSYTVLDDFVLEPSPEALDRGSRHRRRRRRRRADALLIEYFDVTQEACEACSALLAAIGTARRHHLTLRRLLARMDDDGGGAAAAARDALAAHVRLDNPLSPGCLAGFHEVHARCGPLASRLAAAQCRLRRLARAARVACDTATAIVAAVVFAAHAVVGVGKAAAALGATRPRRAVDRRQGERAPLRARGGGGGRGGARRVHRGARPGHGEPHGAARARRAGARPRRGAHRHARARRAAAAAGGGEGGGGVRGGPEGAAGGAGGARLPLPHHHQPEQEDGGARDDACIAVAADDDDDDDARKLVSYTERE